MRPMKYLMETQWKDYQYLKLVQIIREPDREVLVSPPIEEWDYVLRLVVTISRRNAVNKLGIYAVSIEALDEEIEEVTKFYPTIIWEGLTEEWKHYLCQLHGMSACFHQSYGNDIQSLQLIAIHEVKNIPKNIDYYLNQRQNVRATCIDWMVGQAQALHFIR